MGEVLSFVRRRNTFDPDIPDMMSEADKAYDEAFRTFAIFVGHAEATVAKIDEPLILAPHECAERLGRGAPTDASDIPRVLETLQQGGRPTV
jgi:hypothetical protein